MGDIASGRTAWPEPLQELSKVTTAQVFYLHETSAQSVLCITISYLLRNSFYELCRGSLFIFPVALKSGVPDKHISHC